MTYYPAVIIGAGPAGLSAANELTARGVRCLVIEKDDQVGGIARTETYKGFRFDIGGHRFYTKVGQIQALWAGMLDGDFRKTPRLSRIYYQGRFFVYPLQLADTLRNLGLAESALVMLSYLKAKVRPHPVEETFEQWVSNRFGQRLYRAFFQVYTEKVWGIPCTTLRADWAAQRIKGLSVWSVLAHAFGGANHVKTLIHEFDYPRLGPGMMWERFRDTVACRGGQVDLRAEVTALRHDGRRIKGVQVRRGGSTQEITTDHVISSMSAQDLILRMDPPAPPEVIEAAKGLQYRALMLVGLILDQAQLFPDNWIYVHDPEVKVGRIQNYKNWSAALVPDARKTSLGMEYFCTEGDDLWQTPDAELIQLASRELDVLGLADSNKVEDGVVFRQPAAYPVYDEDYRRHLQVIRRYIAMLGNLQTIGRNGTHHYNNMDHSMVTGIFAAKNVLGEDYDVWNVNTEQSYSEETDAHDHVAATSRAA